MGGVISLRAGGGVEVAIGACAYNGRLCVSSNQGCCAGLHAWPNVHYEFVVIIARPKVKPDLTQVYVSTTFVFPAGILAAFCSAAPGELAP